MGRVKKLPRMWFQMKLARSHGQCRSMNLIRVKSIREQAGGASLHTSQSWLWALCAISPRKLWWEHSGCPRTVLWSSNNTFREEWATELVKGSMGIWRCIDSLCLVQGTHSVVWWGSCRHREHDFLHVTDVCGRVRMHANTCLFILCCDSVNKRPKIWKEGNQIVHFLALWKMKL